MIELNTNHLTDKEFLAQIETIGIENIKIRFEKVISKLEVLESEACSKDKWYESALEQSEFRRQGLENIISLAEDMLVSTRYKEIKKFYKDIMLIIGDSFIEL